MTVKFKISHKPKAGAGRPRALIIDDDPTIRMMARQSLDDAGFSVEIAETGAKGLALFERIQPDVVLLDVGLPEMDGFSVCRALRRLPAGARTPVLMMTGRDDVDSINLAYEVNATDFITKPINWTLLCHRVRYMMRACQAEEELGRSEEKFRTVFEDALDVIVIVDEGAGLIINVNAAARDILGYESEMLIGKPLSSLFAPRSTLLTEELLAKLRAGETVFESQNFLRADGSLCPMDLTATMIPLGKGRAALTTLRDVSERKRAEEERTRLATAVAHAAESIFITDTGGIIQYVNPAFERITGYTRDEVIGRDARMLRGDEGDKDVYKSISDTLARGEAWSGHLVSRGKNGARFEVETSVSPIRNEANKTINHVFVERDVTQEVKLRRHFQQAQRLEALGTLAGGIAHDFNNILLAVMGYAELALDDTHEKTLLHDNLQEVIRGGCRASELVKQILAFSRQSEGEKSPTQINAVVKEALKLLRASLPSTIEMRDNIEPLPATVLADPIQMHQVLMNLCTNAAHAMREKGGILEVTLAKVKIDEAFASQHAGIRPGAYVRLTVRDTGHGMTPDVLDRIFDPYFTTKKTTEGSGLGLAVVHGIVTDHGGIITVESELEHGSAFHVYLPVCQKEAASEAVAPEPIATGNESILFVDDEPAVVNMGKQMLERLGYKVTARVGSIEALELFRNAPDRFDLVITDMTMPNMTGEELARKLMGIKAGTPIILCTGFSERISEERAKAMGIRAFIMKPILKRELAETIRSVLDR